MKGTVESCTCSDCVNACHSRPGWMKPKQFREIAAFLGLSLKETFDRYFAIDWWENYKGSNAQAYLIAPALVGHEGKMYPGYPQGTCALLTNKGRCLIHPVKPIECASSWHDKRRFTQGMRLKIVDMWQGKRAQEMIKSLYTKQFRTSHMSPFENLVFILNMGGT
jgi:hypothetical protein